MTKTSNQPQSLRGPIRRATGLRYCATIFLFWIFAVFGLTSRASGAITASTLDAGQAFVDGGAMLMLVDPIGSISSNGFDDNNVRVFDEVQNLTLTSTVVLDVFDPAFGTNLIGAGSVVSSHYLFFDPDPTKDAIGTLTFGQPIIGIILATNQFSSSNGVLGNPTASYSVSNPKLDNNDTVTFAGNMLSFDITARSPGDGLRVLTGINPIQGITLCDPGDITIAGTLTGGGAFNQGGQVIQICDPIGDVGDDNFQSPNVYTFEEQQAVLLQADLFLDSTNFIAAGETVSSFYVVFDPNLLTSVIATIDFSDTIIGVIRDQQELNDSTFLGDASANYLSPSQLGLESFDMVSISGSQLTFDVTASSPGDSVRVILGSASSSLNFNACDPVDITLFGSVTGGSAALAGGVFTQLCDPINYVGNDNYQSNDLFAFEEQLNTTLATSLDTDDGPMATIPAGTLVSSYYVAFDPGGSGDLAGSIQFPQPILGIMTSTTTLISSDFLGNPTGTYLNPSARGLEAGTDSASVSGDTVTIDFSASSPGDYIRVLVAGAPPVPAMGPLGSGFVIMLGTGLGIRGCKGLVSRRS